MSVACPCADADHFSLTVFLFGEFSCKENKTLAITASVFSFFVQGSLPNKKFLSYDDKNCQHQHKGKLHTSTKSQDVATSMEDGVTNTVHTSKIKTSCMCS